SHGFRTLTSVRIAHRLGLLRGQSFSLKGAVVVPYSREPTNRKRLCRLHEGIAKYATVSYIMRVWIPRDIEPRLQRSVRTRPVVVLTGARQTGKTSTLLRLFHAYRLTEIYVDEECFRIAGRAGGYYGTRDALLCRDSLRKASNHGRDDDRSGRFSRTAREPGH